jgi:hypothetical protein
MKEHNITDKTKDIALKIEYYRGNQILSNGEKHFNVH